MKKELLQIVKKPSISEARNSLNRALIENPPDKNPEFFKELLKAREAVRDEKDWKELVNELSRHERLQFLCCFDTTGSMYPYLDRVRKELRTLISEIKEEIPESEFMIIAYGDHCDEGTTYLMKPSGPFTSDIGRLQEFITTVGPTHGGDEPEALECVLHYINTEVRWKENSQRVIAIVADSPPHGAGLDTRDSCPNRRDWENETLRLAQNGVRVYPVLCGGNKVTKACFEKIASLTKGEFLTLDKISNLTSLLVAICMTEMGKLSEFLKKLEKRGELTEDKRRLFLPLTERSERQGSPSKKL